MDAPGDAGDGALTCGSQEIALELDGCEVIGSLGEVGKGPVAAGGIRQGDDHRGVQVSIGGEQLGAQDQAARQAARLQTEEFDADQARQVALSAGI